MVSSSAIRKMNSIPDSFLCQFPALPPFSGRRENGTETGKAPFGAAE
jgi:hypothetical protein